MKYLHTATFLFLLTLFGCQPLDEGSPTNSNTNTLNDLRVDGVDYENPNSLGKTLYEAQCQSCHFENGSGPSGSPLISCSTCGNLTTLTDRITDTMPPADAESVTGSDAKAIAEYVIAKFNYISAGTNTVDIGAGDIELLSPTTAAYRLAFDIKSGLPTADELNQFDQGNGNLVVDQWLNSEGFYQRLMAIYNKGLKSDGYHSRYERESNYRNLRDLVWACPRGIGGTCNSTATDREPYFTNVIWWNDLPFEGLLADLTNDAFAREPLELIKHVAKNDLPFSDILTADYTMVNAYSTKAYDPIGLDGSPITMADFNLIETPNEQVEIDMVLVDRINIEPFKQVFYDLNRLKASDVQYNAGNDDNKRLFVTDYPQDPRHFVPARLKQGNIDLPHAGILSTKAFLNRFTTTPTNVHRARARWVYQIFAATDILAIEGNRDASLIDFSDSLGAMDPTKTNEDCLVCHRKIDPVADAFKNWTYNGTYINANCSISNSINECATKPGVGVGFEGQDAPVFGNNSVDANALQWLGKAVSDNNLFAKSVAHNLFESFTGDDVLPLDLSKNQQYQNDYAVQQRVILAAINAFNDNNKNVKAAAKTILLSPYYLAESTTGSYQLLGSDRLLTPDEIQLKLYSATKHVWSQAEVDDSFAMHLGNRSAWRLYGGADGINTLEGPDEQGSIMYTMQERLANETACFLTAQELARAPASRQWLNNLTYQMPMANNDTMIPSDNEQAVKQSIVNMHRVFWLTDVAIDSPEVDIAYNLYQQVQQQGFILRSGGAASRDLDFRCRVDYHPDSNYLLPGEERLYKDDYYTVRTWAALTAYFLADYRFSHM